MYNSYNLLALNVNTHTPHLNTIVFPVDYKPPVHFAFLLRFVYRSLSTMMKLPQPLVSEATVRPCEGDEQGSQLPQDCPCGFLSRNGFRSPFCWACDDDEQDESPAPTSVVERTNSEESQTTSRPISPIAPIPAIGEPVTTPFLGYELSLSFLLPNGREVTRTVNVSDPNTLRASPYYRMPRVNVRQCIDGAIRAMTTGRTASIRLTSRGLYCNYGSSCRPSMCTRVLHPPQVALDEEALFWHFTRQAFGDALH